MGGPTINCVFLIPIWKVLSNNLEYHGVIIVGLYIYILRIMGYLNCWIIFSILECHMSHGDTGDEITLDHHDYGDNLWDNQQFFGDLMPILW